MTNFLKPVSIPVNTKQEIQTLTNVFNSGITFTLCDRTVLTDKRSNYFISFNLPYQQSAFPTGNTLSLSNPELQQLNVDQVIIGNIDSSYYNQLIDGRSIQFTCPQFSGTSLSAKTIISSTYVTLDKTQENPLLGSNIAFLFCDEINTPYSGTVSGIQRTYTTWNSNTSYVNRPPAVSYSQMSPSDINTDKRNGNFAVSVSNVYPTNSSFGYNYDIPVGFVALDKGFIVLTHPKIVNNFPFAKGNNSDGTPNSLSANTNIHFTSSTTCNVEFVDLNTIFKTSVICYIMPGEFYKSTNPSWDSKQAQMEESMGTNGYESIYISELALHNVNGEVIAYAKLDAPIKKNYGDFVAFTIDLTV